jgi:transcriptional activator for dhaKLM operon
MQPTAYPIQLEQLTAAWRVFMETGKTNPETSAHLDPAVLQSWRRCIPRLNPLSRVTPAPITRQALSSILRAQSELITVATPFIEDIHQFVEGSHTAILLADGAGCAVAVQGDETAVAGVNALGLGQGTYWSEERLGTNALGVVLAEAMPVQVVGPEHYLQRLHHLVTTAAPIHDVRGRIVGILGLVGAVEAASSHTLGLVMSAARAIGNQLQADWYLREANHRLSEVNTILGSIAEGRAYVATESAHRGRPQTSGSAYPLAAPDRSDRRQCGATRCRDHYRRARSLGALPGHIAADLPRRSRTGQLHRLTQSH